MSASTGILYCCRVADSVVVVADSAVVVANSVVVVAGSAVLVAADIILDLSNRFSRFSWHATW